MYKRVRRLKATCTSVSIRYPYILRCPYIARLARGLVTLSTTTVFTYINYNTVFTGLQVCTQLFQYFCAKPCKQFQEFSTRVDLYLFLESSARLVLRRARFYFQKQSAHDLCRLLPSRNKGDILKIEITKRALQTTRSSFYFQTARTTHSLFKSRFWLVTRELGSGTKIGQTGQTGHKQQPHTLPVAVTTRRRRSVATTRALVGAQRPLY